MWGRSRYVNYKKKRESEREREGVGEKKGDEESDVFQILFSDFRGYMRAKQQSCVVGKKLFQHPCNVFLDICIWRLLIKIAAFAANVLLVRLVASTVRQWFEGIEKKHAYSDLLEVKSS